MGRTRVAPRPPGSAHRTPGRARSCLRRPKRRRANRRFRSWRPAAADRSCRERCPRRESSRPVGSDAARRRMRQAAEPGRGRVPVASYPLIARGPAPDDPVFGERHQGSPNNTPSARQRSAACASGPRLRFAAARVREPALRHVSSIVLQSGISRSCTRGCGPLHERDDARRLPASLAPRIRRILSDLDAAAQPGDMNVPGYRLHPLTGGRRGRGLGLSLTSRRPMSRFHLDASQP